GNPCGISRRPRGSSGNRARWSALVGEAVGHAKEGDGVAELRAAPGIGQSLVDVVPGHLAVGGEPVGLEFGDLAIDRAADLDRDRMKLLLHAVCAGMARTPFNGQDLR